MKRDAIKDLFSLKPQDESIIIKKKAINGGFEKLSYMINDLCPRPNRIIVELVKIRSMCFDHINAQIKEH